MYSFWSTYPTQLFDELIRFQNKFKRRGVKNPFKHNRDPLTFTDVVRRVNESYFKRKKNELND